MREDYLERLDRLDRMANAAPQGLLVHRATLDLRACLVRPGPRAGRAILARLAPQAPPVSAAPPDLQGLMALKAQPDLQVAKVQQEQRALLVRRA